MAANWAALHRLGKGLVAARTSARTEFYFTCITRPPARRRAAAALTEPFAFDGLRPAANALLRSWLKAKLFCEAGRTSPAAYFPSQP